MSFHVFLQEEVDTAIYEVGVGGAWDSTNVIQVPAVTGVTTLGLDHIAQLGDTIEKIAWHKGSIYKENVPAYSVRQVPEAYQVLEQRAADKGLTLQLVDILPRLSGFKIIPDADFQRQNASLAMVLADTVLRKINPSKVDEQSLEALVKSGIEQTTWRGRCETMILGNVNWHLDSAHTAESVRVAAAWFSREVQNR